MGTFFANSLFYRLFSYRPREGRIAAEDFFTEAFVGVLERDPKLLNDLFYELSGNEVKKANIYSQVCYSIDRANNSRPDITIIGHDSNGEQHIILIESKLGSEEGGTQLERYTKVLLNRHEKTKTLIYLTKFADKKKAKPKTNRILFKQIRWYEIYNFLKNRLQQNQQKNSIAMELLKLMEDFQMSFNIKVSELLAGVSYNNSLRKLWNVLDHSWETSDLCKHLQTLLKKGKFQSYSTGEVSYATPQYGQDKITLHFGISFATQNEEDFELDFKNPELPCIYLAILKYPSRETKDIYNKYRSYFDQVSQKKEWKLLKDLDAVIIRKCSSDYNLNSTDVSYEFINFLINSFNEIINAPFWK